MLHVESSVSCDGVSTPVRVVAVRRKIGSGHDDGSRLVSDHRNVPLSSRNFDIHGGHVSGRLESCDFYKVLLCTVLRIITREICSTPVIRDGERLV